jgi:hypothetical protein
MDKFKNNKRTKTYKPKLKQSIYNKEYNNNKNKSNLILNRLEILN